jgi:hypothetical protein
MCYRLLKIIWLTVLVSPYTFGSVNNAVEEVDIGVFYTSAALKERPIEKIYELLMLRTKIANTALKASNIPLKRNVVIFESSPVVHDNKTRLRQVVVNAHKSGVFESYIRRFGLDYITIFTAVSGADGCGYAQLGGIISVIRVSARCNREHRHYLLAHEWGHLDGAAHQAGDKAAKRYGVGYVCDGRGTIMNKSEHPAKKHYVYSSVRKNTEIDGCGQKNVADVARMINQRMKEQGAIQNTQPKMAIISNVHLQLDDTVFSEMDGYITGKVILDKPLTEEVSVQVFTENISTNRDIDYFMQRLFFPIGTTEAALRIGIIDDDEPEADEQLKVGLHYPEKLNITSQTQVVTILSDDE